MTIRLRSITFILLILVAIVPVTVLSITLYKQMYNFTYQSVDSRLAASASQITAELSHSNEVLTNGLRLLAEQDSVIKSIDELLYSIQLPAILGKFVADTPLVESLYLVDADGFVIESSGGNILALEQSNILHQDRASPFITEKIGTKSKIYLIDNYSLVTRSGMHHSLVHVVPIYSDNAMDHVNIMGYLIAVVPVYALTDAVSIELQDQESLAIYFKGQQLEGNLIGDDNYDVSHSSSLILSGRAYQNSVWLSIKVGQRLETLDAQVRDSMAPGMASSLIVIIVIIAVVMLFAHLVSKAFGQLYALIKDFEKGRQSEWLGESHIAIQEFADVAALLAEMKSTIGEQLHTVNKKNKELARIDKLRASYLEEVQSLNSKLEFKVEERTKDLEQSMDKLGQSHFFFQQLIQFRRILESSGGNREIAKAAIQILAECYPNGGTIIHLPASRGHRMVNDCLGVDVENFELLQSRVLEKSRRSWDRFSIEFKQQLVNVFGIRCGNGRMGWLLLNETKLTEDQNNQILLFITELSAFLENRTLNEELDFVARTDSLTGIKNRKAFDELQFSLETQLDAEVGLFIIDVNGLKQMNDQKGHEKGDQLIISVARVLGECCTGITAHFYRIGGDEFAAVLSGEQLALAEQLEERLMARQNNRVGIELDSFAGEPLVSFSVGYASTNDVDFSDLYKLADQNMYHNKQSYYSILRQTEL
ncbi:sensor domain-containing diguanylate cyclase [Agarivorans sp. TSD2052]|uniref:sensor domain-containing diguanylate cyclase n=1 Tax=Agarivorans sp. TSD2052 TaxID=2937286 RepID=UPI00200BC306|nr:diguanylate cyclase [Agarivorans sp. TSD2052]UPW16748.1 sensor domain-containing diguanylate cyclase [Agarivorans sp. TSD2052]